MAEALGPTQLESVVPGFRSSGILVDDSVCRIGFGWEAGSCWTLVVNSRRASGVVRRVTIVWTTVNESQNARWVSFRELNDVDCPSALDFSLRRAHRVGAGKGLSRPWRTRLKGTFLAIIPACSL